MHPIQLLALLALLALVAIAYSVRRRVMIASGQYRQDVANRKAELLLTLAGGDDQTGEWIDVRGAMDVGVMLAMTTLTGGTLDVKIQTSPDKVAVFNVAGGAFTQQADGVPLSQEIAPANLGVLMRYVRVIADQAAGVSASAGMCYMTYRGGFIARQQTANVGVTG